VRAVNFTVDVYRNDIEGALKVLKRKFYEVRTELNVRREPNRNRRRRAKRLKAEDFRRRMEAKRAAYYEAVKAERKREPAPRAHSIASKAIRKAA
jgi:hypothetical protein